MPLFPKHFATFGRLDLNLYSWIRCYGKILISDLQGYTSLQKRLSIHKQALCLYEKIKEPAITDVHSELCNLKVHYKNKVLGLWLLKISMDFPEIKAAGVVFSWFLIRIHSNIIK